MSIRDLLEPITNEKEKAEITARYIRVFGSEDGKWVFSDIMVNLGFFDYQQTDPVSMERMNFARFLLKRLGVLDPVKVHAVIGSLMNLSAVPTQKKGRK